MRRIWRGSFADGRLSGESKDEQGLEALLAGRLMFGGGEIKIYTVIIIQRVLVHPSELLHMLAAVRLSF